MAKKAELNEFGEQTLEKHQFAFFVGCCKALVKLTGMLDWEVSYLFIESDEDSPRASTMIHDKFNRLASIQLYDSWNSIPSEFHLWRVAFHEVMELLFSDLHCLAMDRGFDYNTYDREHHRVIRILEAAWFDGMWQYGHEVFNFQSDGKGGKRSGQEIPELGGQLSLPDPKLSKNKRSRK
jgi:hypothetical protein